VRPYLEKTHHKKGWWSGLRYKSCIQIPVSQKKKKRLKKIYNVNSIFYVTGKGECLVTVIGQFRD
jgi:hypothetical protein